MGEALNHQRVRMGAVTVKHEAGMNDLTERLRARTLPQWTHTTGFGSRMNGHKPDELCQQAADEIAQLREANEAFGKRQKWWTDRMFDLEQEVERLRAEPHSCVWAQADSDTDLWETSCCRSFCLNEGTPTENHMTWCCYCGKPLEEHPWVDEEDAA